MTRALLILALLGLAGCANGIRTPYLCITDVYWCTHSVYN